MRGDEGREPSAGDGSIGERERRAKSRKRDRSGHVEGDQAGRRPVWTLNDAQQPVISGPR